MHGDIIAAICFKKLKLGVFLFHFQVTFSMLEIYNEQVTVIRLIILFIIGVREKGHLHIWP